MKNSSGWSSSTYLNFNSGNFCKSERLCEKRGRKCSLDHQRKVEMSRSWLFQTCPRNIFSPSIDPFWTAQHLVWWHPTLRLASNFFQHCQFFERSSWEPTEEKSKSKLFLFESSFFTFRSCRTGFHSWSWVWWCWTYRIYVLYDILERRMYAEMRYEHILVVEQGVNKIRIVMQWMRQSRVDDFQHHPDDLFKDAQVLHLSSVQNRPITFPSPQSLQTAENVWKFLWRCRESNSHNPHVLVQNHSPVLHFATQIALFVPPSECASFVTERTSWNVETSCNQ